MTNEQKPLISVIFPVYNCPAYVGEALDSILHQTFTDFELILIDDGSTDSTPEILKRYRDPRIQLFTQVNRGLAGTLNRGIELARGKYIARMDQDDVSMPQRFEKQVSFLENHPRCALLGTWAQIWEERTKTERFHTHPIDNSTLKFELLFNNPFVHSSVMLRSDAIRQVGSYSVDPARQPPEDYELWSRIARKYEVANIPEVLQSYREVKTSMSRNGPSPFQDHLVTISAENIAWASGQTITNPAVINISALAHQAIYRIEATPDFIKMRSVLRQAIICIVAPDHQKLYFRQAEDRLLAWWFSYFQKRYQTSWIRYLLAAARRGYRSYQALKQLVFKDDK